MELPRLAAKQKRYVDILNFAEHEVKDPQVKPNLLKVLGSYKQALAKCWSAQAVTPENQLEIETIERELETLHNQARLRSNQP